VLPEKFRTYSVLADSSPRHWTVDAYVLAEDNSVLFTFEGDLTHATERSVISQLSLGLRYALVSQNNQWPAERYMMYWQPRALPLTDLKGAVILEGPSNGSETTEILHLLDQLALKYTGDNLK
jgi:fatty acid synthase, animal type